MSQGLQVCNAGGLCRAMSGILKALMSLFQEALLEVLMRWGGTLHRRDCESKILERGKTRGNREASCLAGGGRASHLRYESDSGQVSPGRS